jgi:hypothetical protein
VQVLAASHTGNFVDGKDERGKKSLNKIGLNKTKLFFFDNKFNTSFENDFSSF